MIVTVSIKLPTNGRGTTCSELLRPVLNNHDPGLQRIFQKSFEMCSFEKIGGISAPIAARVQPRCANGLIACVHEAFANERALALSPDHIWTAIVQAVSIHANANAERLRDRFVSPARKKDIVVRNDALRLGQPTSSPWHDVFPVFRARLDDIVKNAEFVADTTASFSTTTNLFHVVFTVALLNTFNSYFNYEIVTSCGIARIDLGGTVDDWKQLRARAARICFAAKMDWWAGELLPVLDRFVALSSGTGRLADAREFWARIYRWHPGQSGRSDRISGWLNVFFPYSVESDGSFRRRASTFARAQLDVATYPSGTSCVPFKWDYSQNELDMRFCAGFVAAVGTVQHDTNTVTPVLGWAVAHAPKTQPVDSPRTRVEHLRDQAIEEQRNLQWLEKRRDPSVPGTSSAARTDDRSF